MTWFSKDAGRYLAEEVHAPVRREYVGGHVYAMAGASNRHNQIATNALIALGLRLRGILCSIEQDGVIRLGDRVRVLR